MAEADPETVSEEGSEDTALQKPTTNVNKNGIFINIKTVLIGLGAIAAVCILGFVVFGFIKDRQARKKRNRILKRNRERRKWDD